MDESLEPGGSRCRRRILMSRTCQGGPGLFWGAFLEKEKVVLGRVGVEEVAEQGKKMLVFKGAFGEMKVAGVQVCKGVFYKGEVK